MAIKLKSNSAYDGQLQETNTAARQYYLPNNDSGLGTQLMTAQASTSGTSVDFSGIPSWAKRITVMFNGVSTNGTSHNQVQIGAGSVTTSGYTSAHSITNSAGSNLVTATSGFIVMQLTAASDSYAGSLILTLVSGNVWVAMGSGYRIGTAATMSFAGNISLGGVLDRVRVTTVNGTDTFDAGSINVMYE